MAKKKNPKTTKWGLLTFIGILIMGAGAALDGNPETLVDVQALVTAAGALIGGISAMLQGRASQDED